MPAYKVTSKDQKIVESMSGFGFTEQNIADLLEIDRKTLRKYFRRELDTGHIKANSQVAQSLFRKALGDGPQAVTACIFWMKTRCGWKEPTSAAEYVSKKEELQWAAKRAGLGTEWGEDLTTTPSPNEVN